MRHKKALSSPKRAHGARMLLRLKEISHGVSSTSKKTPILRALIKRKKRRKRYKKRQKKRLRTKQLALKLTLRIWT